MFVCVHVPMLLCFIAPRVRKIRSKASSCLRIFSRRLHFYYVPQFVCMLLCFMKLMLGNRHGPVISSRASRGYTEVVEGHYAFCVFFSTSEFVRYMAVGKAPQILGACPCKVHQDYPTQAKNTFVTLFSVRVWPTQSKTRSRP